MVATIEKVESPSFVKVNRSKDLVDNLKKIADNLQSNSGKKAFLTINGTSLSQERIFLEPLVCNAKEVVFTTYFISKKDPQSKKFIPNNTIGYIKPWYESINQLQLTGIVFHDGLSKEFIEKFTTDYVHFVECRLGTYSLNDERFIIYYLFLLKYCPKLEWVLMTDGNDVTITKKPFDWMGKKGKDVIFVGRNDGHLIRQSERFYRKINWFEKDFKEKVPNNFYNLPVYNAGILGGSFTSVIYQLNRMITFFLACDSNKNHNMPIFNLTIYEFWHPKVKRGWRQIKGKFFFPSIYYFFFHKIPFLPILWRLRTYLTTKKVHNNRNDHSANTNNIITSYPFCSAFKKFETDSDAYIIHK